MIGFLSNNIGTIIVLLVLITVVASIVFHQIKLKKKGKNTCGCGCSSCAMSEICHKK